MFNGVVTDTNMILYLMAALGVVGVLAKLINQITLQKMVKAAANMSKSTHELMKLVRAKFEHACMAYDKVENVDAFVEKYIYEYREILFRIHTWRQVEIQTIWFVGGLALFGVVEQLVAYGVSDRMYQYLVLGVAECAVLFIICQLTDEKYQIGAVQNYMIDYLENSCAHKYHKVRAKQKDEIDVIPTESVAVSQSAVKVAEQIAHESCESKESDLKEDTIRQILEEFLV